MNNNLNNIDNLDLSENKIKKCLQFYVNNIDNYYNEDIFGLAKCIINNILRNDNYKLLFIKMNDKKGIIYKDENDNEIHDIDMILLKNKIYPYFLPELKKIYEIKQLNIMRKNYSKEIYSMLMAKNDIIFNMMVNSINPLSYKNYKNYKNNDEKKDEKKENEYKDYIKFNNYILECNNEFKKNEIYTLK